LGTPPAEIIVAQSKNEYVN